jgi:hypothetical protein
MKLHPINLKIALAFYNHLSAGVELQFLLKVPLMTSVPASIRYGMTGWF